MHRPAPVGQLHTRHLWRDRTAVFQSRLARRDLQTSDSCRSALRSPCMCCPAEGHAVASGRGMLSWRRVEGRRHASWCGTRGEHGGLCHCGSQRLKPSTVTRYETPHPANSKVSELSNLERPLPESLLGERRHSLDSQSAYSSSRNCKLAELKMCQLDELRPAGSGFRRSLKSAPSLPPVACPASER
jgi:hypothetical protein